MARDYGRMKVSIWRDDDFRSLPETAQLLYAKLISHPTLNYAGVADWRPNRIAKLSADSTADTVRKAGLLLEEHGYVVMDDETEEIFVRSFVRHNEILKIPNLAVAMAGAYAGIASDVIRDAFVVELVRLRADEPGMKGWGVATVKTIVNSAPPDPSGKSSVNPSSDPSPNGSGNPSDRGSDNPSGKGSDNPSGKGSIEGYPNPSNNPSVKGSTTSNWELVTSNQEQTTSAISSPTTTPPEKPTPPELVEDTTRPDVERLCEHLADRIAANGSKPPTITTKWRTSARLMLDRDGHTEDQIRAAIDWSQNDPFWQANILSMPKLRDKYDTLRLLATRGRASPADRPTPIPDKLHTCGNCEAIVTEGEEAHREHCHPAASNQRKARKQATAAANGGWKPPNLADGEVAT